MADAAVLHDGGVFPQERPAQLGMAAKARVVDRGTPRERIADIAVGVVAVSAEQLAAAHRVRGQLERIGCDAAMATGARFGLTVAGSNRVRLVVDDVAVRTSESRVLVRAAGPVRPLVVRVAGEAKTVLHGRVRVAAPTEVDHRFARCAIGQNACGVPTRWPVAGFALHACRQNRTSGHLEWRSGHAGVAVNGGEHRKRREGFLLVVTAEARVRPTTRVVAFPQLVDEFIVCLASPMRADRHQGQRDSMHEPSTAVSVGHGHGVAGSHEPILKPSIVSVVDTCRGRVVPSSAHGRSRFPSPLCTVFLRAIIL